MAIGDPVTVREGPFANLSGTIVRESGDSLVVALSIFGRTAEVPLTRAQLATTPLTLEGMEAEIGEAVARRGFRQRLFGFWEEEALRTPQRAEAELASLFSTFETGVLREQEAAQHEALERFRAQFQPLDAAARARKWAEEKEAWTSWRAEARAVTEALEAPWLGALEGDARFAEARRIGDTAHELRTRVDAWRRRQSLTGPAPTEPRNEALEAEIERDLERDEPFLVYADWLLSHGNRRGELIALSGKPQEEALRKRLAPQLWGGLAGFADSLEAKWRLGFLESVKVEATREDEANGIDVLQLLDNALKLTSSRVLRELTIACPSVHEDQLAARLPALLAAQGPRPALRSLSFITNQEEEMLSWTSAGELAGYGTLFPNLQTLSVHAGSFGLTQPRFPKLRSLVLQTCGLTADNLQALIGAEWPELERLELWFGSSAYGVEFTLAQLEPLLRSPGFPKLTSLALCNCELADALCEAVLDSPLLPRLRSLSLAKGTMTEAGANTLVAGAQQLRHLERLDVDDNYLPAEALAALCHAVPSVRSTEQRTAEAYEGQLHRYAAVGE